MDNNLRMETLAIQAGYNPKSGEPRQMTDEQLEACGAGADLAQAIEKA